MKDYKATFKLDEQEYDAIFNLNVMEQIQDKYGSVKEWGALTDAKSGEPNAKAIIFGFWAMMNEAVDIDNDENGANRPNFTLKQVGRIISMAGVEASAKTLNKAVIEATKEDTPKNA
jgi:hypothetical protein